MGMVGSFKLKVKHLLQAYQWRKMNNHNFTELDSVVSGVDQITVGNGTYGTLHVDTFGNRNAKLKIGHFCSIAREVRFIIDGEHCLDRVSLYPFQARYAKGNAVLEAEMKGHIVIDDDVWIGERCLILSGVHIHQGAVIGAGSVVAKDIPPYAVWAGGRIIKYRFDDEKIEKLKRFDYSKIRLDNIETAMMYLYENIDEFLESDFYKEHLR